MVQFLLHYSSIFFYGRCYVLYEYVSARLFVELNSFSLHCFYFFEMAHQCFMFLFTQSSFSSLRLFAKQGMEMWLSEYLPFPSFFFFNMFLNWCFKSKYSANQYSISNVKDVQLGASFLQFPDALAELFLQSFHLLCHSVN